jgi:general secretion pathway protein L
MSMSFPSSTILRPLAQFWAWWVGEITAMAPASWRRQLTRGPDRLVLAVNAGGGGAALFHRSNDGEEPLGRLDLDPAAVAEARGQLAAVPARLRKGGFVSIRLPPEAALRTVMNLPLAAERNLAEVVAFELDHRTPFKPEEVYRSQRVLRRDPTAKRLAVQVTLVPRPTLDAALAAAERLGLRADRVEAAGEPPSGNLLPAQPRPLAARMPGWSVAALASLALLLALVAAFLPLEEAHRTAAALAREASDSKRQAEESLRLQKEIEGEIRESGFLETRKRETPSPSELLQALTHLLPDDTWLGELEISGQEVRITGYSGSASTVLGLIDQFPRFSNAAFRSPVTQDRKEQREQFNISARIVAEKAP